MKPSHIDHVPELLSRFDNKSANLASILEAVLDEYTYVPEKAIRLVAVRLQMPVAEVIEVAQRLKSAHREPEPAEV